MEDITDAQPRDSRDFIEAAPVCSRPVRIDPRTGQPYKQRTEAEWKEWRDAKALREQRAAPAVTAADEPPPAKRSPNTADPTEEAPKAKPVEQPLGPQRFQRVGFSVRDVQGAETLQHALERFVLAPGDCMGVRYLWETQPRKLPEYALGEPYTWQRLLKAELAEPRDQSSGRRLTWLWNADGNVGMSTFCRWMTQGHEDTVLTLQQGGRMGDVAHMIAHHVSVHGHGPSVILVDLGRAVARRNIYATLEAMLNGAMFSSKYESRSVFIDKPHVVCFANWPPETGKQSLSEDRWDVRKIKINARAKGYAVMEPMTLAQVREARAQMTADEEAVLQSDD